MPDEHGEIAYSCDCTKKQAFTFTCIHIQFVEQYPMEFGNALFEGEEPTSFLIRQERKTWMFSIASQSGSSRHHSHKRVIVTLTGYDEWNVHRVSKSGTYPFHILVLTYLAGIVNI
jgi:hypothetical protein